MNDKLLSFIGLCRRAGKMTIGNDPVAEDIKKGISELVLIADDISHNTEKDITKKAEDGKVRIIKIPYSKEQVSVSLGRLTAVISVNDEGFAKKIIELIDKN